MPHCQIRDHLKGNLKAESAKEVLQVLFGQTALKTGIFCPFLVTAELQGIGVDGAGGCLLAWRGGGKQRKTFAKCLEPGQDRWEALWVWGDVPSHDMEPDL